MIRPAVPSSVARAWFAVNRRHPRVTAITALRDSRCPSRCRTRPRMASIDFCSRSRERRPSQASRCSLVSPKQVWRSRSIGSLSVPAISSATPQAGLSSRKRIRDSVELEKLMSRARHVRRHVGDEVVGAERGPRRSPAGPFASPSPIRDRRGRCRGTPRRPAAADRRSSRCSRPPSTGCGAAGRPAAASWTIDSNDRMVCTTPSSRTSKSAWVRSVTGLPSAVTKTSVRTKLASVRKVGVSGCCPRTRPSGPAPTRTQIPAAATSERTRRDVDMDCAYGTMRSGTSRRFGPPPSART